MIEIRNIFYVWRNNQVEEVERNLDHVQSIRSLYCVDANCEKTVNRYGIFYFSANKYWMHVPLEDFPVDFRMALLILGVQ